MDPFFASLREHLTAGLQTLPDKPEESADNTLRALWHAAAGQPRSVVAAACGELPRLAGNGERAALERLVARRLAGEPLAYLTGRVRFMGIEMLSAPGALIPRVETELLTRACVDLLHDTMPSHPARVVDVCTGSGSIAFAIARMVPGVEVAAADISAEAVGLAHRNAEFLGLQRVDLRCGDLLDPFGHDFDERIDVVACCPPYIQTGKVGSMATEISAHEPRLAFDGGPLGVSILLRLLEESPRLLRRGGWLAFEVGLGQGPAMSRRLQRDAHYGEVRTQADAHGDVRVVLARRA